MASITLILIEQTSAAELGTKAMDEHERYHVYTCCRDGELLTVETKRYTVHGVRWDPAEARLYCRVSFHSYASTDDCCD